MLEAPRDFVVTKKSKGNGKFRIICRPRKRLKESLNAMVASMEEGALALCPPGVVHGFWPGRSCVSNAAAHKGFRYTVCFDLKDFFHTCTNRLFSSSWSYSFDAFVNPGLLGMPAVTSTADYVLPQGFPTSPPASNICAAGMDASIVGILGNAAGPTVYTRYADDLTFSFNEGCNIFFFLRDVPKITSRAGFTINPAKTRVQWAGAGRRIITGVAVDDEVHPTRATKRKLRAAKFKAQRRKNPHYEHRASGLEEWAKCKMPGLGKKTIAMVKECPEEALQIAARMSRYR